MVEGLCKMLHGCPWNPDLSRTSFLYCGCLTTFNQFYRFHGGDLFLFSVVIDAAQFTAHITLNLVWEQMYILRSMRWGMCCSATPVEYPCCTCKKLSLLAKVKFRDKPLNQIFRISMKLVCLQSVCMGLLDWNIFFIWTSISWSGSDPLSKRTV